MEGPVRITIYDSIFLSIDDETRKLLTQLFGNSNIVMGKGPKQEGSKDCSIFAIATCASLANGSLSHLYEQTKMRSHLTESFNNLKFNQFP